MPNPILSIDSPAHGAVFVGLAQASVSFHGSVEHPAPEGLFYKWYSSLNNPPPAAGSDVHLNAVTAGSPALAFSKALGVGSHIIVLSAKDVAADTVAAIQSVQEAGMAGGPEAPNATPCIVHVLLAEILEPSGAVIPALSKAAAVIEMKAPLKWAAPVPPSPPGPFVRDAEYHAINRVRFRFRFETPGGGAPIAGLPALNPTPAALDAFQETLSYGLDDDDPPTPFLRYSGPLPSALAIGDTYDLVLRAEDAALPSRGHEARRTIEVAP